MLIRSVLIVTSSLSMWLPRRKAEAVPHTAPVRNFVSNNLPKCQYYQDIRCHDYNRLPDGWCYMSTYSSKICRTYDRTIPPTDISTDTSVFTLWMMGLYSLQASMPDSGCTDKNFSGLIEKALHGSNLCICHPVLHLTYYRVNGILNSYRDCWFW